MADIKEMRNRNFRVTVNNAYFHKSKTLTLHDTLEDPYTEEEIVDFINEIAYDIIDEQFYMFKQLPPFTSDEEEFYSTVEWDYEEILEN